MAPTKDVSLAQTDFPLYAVQSLDDKHFVVAGGGGAAKTGVANAIEVYKLSKRGSDVSASPIHRHDTGSTAVMNCSTFSDGRHHHMVAGQDEFCQAYTIKYKVVKEDKQQEGKSENVRQRKTDTAGSKQGGSNGEVKKHLTFVIEKQEKVETDFASDGGFQKCVRFAPKYSSFATGGSDGHLRLWKYTELTKLWEVKAHKDEIDDIDFSPDGSKIVTVSRDKTGSVWAVKDGKKVLDLVWDQKTTGSYKFKFCRYGLVEGKKDKFNLYTVNIPVTRATQSQCYITLWDATKLAIKQTAKAGSEVISAFGVSPDGIYLGVGTLSGSVSVYISFSLQKLYHVKEVHSIFVTGVDFLPASTGTRAVLGDQDFNLVSIAADSSIKLHQCPERSYINPIFVILGVFLIIFIMFYAMAELGI